MIIFHLGPEYSTVTSTVNGPHLYEYFSPVYTLKCVSKELSVKAPLRTHWRRGSSRCLTGQRDRHAAMASYGRRVSNSDVVQSLYGRTSVGHGVVTDINHQVEQVTPALWKIPRF